MKEAPELSDYAFQRAQRLEGVLGRLRQSEVIELRKPNPHTKASVIWVSEHERKRVELTPVFIAGMKKVAATLYTDLADVGEEVLAIDLVDQHRNVRDELLVTHGGTKEE